MRLPSHVHGSGRRRLNVNHLTGYVRTSKIDEVIQALQKADAPGITIVCGVHAVGYGYLPLEFSWKSGELGKAP